MIPKSFDIFLGFFLLLFLVVNLHFNTISYLINKVKLFLLKL